MRLLPEPLGRILQYARHLHQGHHLLHGSRGIDQDAVHLALGDGPAELEFLRALQDSADIFRFDGKKDCRHGQVFTNLTFIPRMWAFPAHARVGQYCKGSRFAGLLSLTQMQRNLVSYFTLCAILGEYALIAKFPESLETNESFASEIG